jgi:DNA-binding MarR family transcriptional regulator
MPTETRRSRALEAFSTMPGHLVRRVYQVSTALFAQECGDVGLTPVQYAALVALRSHPRIDATRLSQAIYFDRSTIGDVLDRLEARGWVVRRPSPDDRRIKLLTIAPDGREVLRRVEPGVRRVQQRLLAPLSATDADTLVRLLAQLADEHDDVLPF